jgi:XapX domain-containing protein
VGLLIGVIFTVLKLPVPVPHGIPGLLGLVGMFIGGDLASRAIGALRARRAEKGTSADR